MLKIPKRKQSGPRRPPGTTQIASDSGIEGSPDISEHHGASKVLPCPSGCTSAVKTVGHAAMATQTDLHVPTRGELRLVFQTFVLEAPFALALLRCDGGGSGVPCASSSGCG